MPVKARVEHRDHSIGRHVDQPLQALQHGRTGGALVEERAHNVDVDAKAVGPHDGDERGVVDSRLMQPRRIEEALENRQSAEQRVTADPARFAGIRLDVDSDPVPG